MGLWLWWASDVMRLMRGVAVVLTRVISEIGRYQFDDISDFEACCRDKFAKGFNKACPAHRGQKWLTRRRSDNSCLQWERTEILASRRYWNVLLNTTEDVRPFKT